MRIIVRVDKEYEERPYLTDDEIIAQANEDLLDLLDGSSWEIIREEGLKK